MGQTSENRREETIRRRRCSWKNLFRNGHMSRSRKASPFPEFFDTARDIVYLSYGLKYSSFRRATERLKRYEIIDDREINSLANENLCVKLFLWKVCKGKGTLFAFIIFHIYFTPSSFFFRIVPQTLSYI